MNYACTMCVLVNGIPDPRIGPFEYLFFDIKEVLKRLCPLPNRVHLDVEID
jgi:hypothetical protein